MTASPYVELGFNPTELRPQDLPRAGAFLGSPTEALEAAFAVVRAQMVDQMKAEVRGLTEPTHGQLLRIADLAWQATFWRYRKVSAPIIADAYVRAYRRADAGDVPMSLIYDLADKHAEKIGGYFHDSSRDALAEGFTSMVNRRVPARVAANRVLDAYGLTPRQMRGYTSAKQFETPVSDVLPRPLKARVRAYIDRSFTSRIRKFSRQEEHNIDQQAQQFAWMWLQDKGRLSEKAQKLWITARDERVCKICGPLHGKRVGVNQQFRTAQGEFWTPGLHPNCRCVVRLLEHRFTKGVFAKAGFDPRLHPRGGDAENKGRFSRKTKAAEPSRPVIPMSDIWESLKERTVPVEPEPKPKARLELPQRASLPTRKASLGRKATLGGKANLESKDKAKLGAAADLNKPSKAKLSSAEVRERISMTVTPQMRAQMETSLSATLAADARKPVLAKRPRKLFHRPTLRIQDENGKEYPVYAVVDPVDVDMTDTRKMDLNHDVVFTPSFSSAAAQAYTRFEEVIDGVYQDLVADIDTHLVYHDDAGVKWKGSIHDEDLIGVIAWKAYQGRVTDSDFTGGNPIAMVRWEGGGGFREEPTAFSDIAEMIGLTSEDFDIKILRLDEGHDSVLGHTSQLTAGTASGTEEWVTSGIYTGEIEETEDVHHNVKMMIWHLQPDVEEEEVETPFD